MTLRIWLQNSGMIVIHHLSRHQIYCVSYFETIPYLYLSSTNPKLNCVIATLTMTLRNCCIVMLSLQKFISTKNAMNGSCLVLFFSATLCLGDKHYLAKKMKMSIDDREFEVYKVTFHYLVYRHLFRNMPIGCWYSQQITF